MSATRTILLPTFGSAGDVNPFIAIGRALQRRGHCVILITNPHFQRKVEASGLDFLGIGNKQDYLDAIENPELWLLSPCPYENIWVDSAAN